MKPKKKVKKRNRKAQDATLINNRARVKEIRELEDRITHLEYLLVHIAYAWDIVVFKNKRKTT